MALTLTLKPCPCHLFTLHISMGSIFTTVVAGINIVLFKTIVLATFVPILKIKDFPFFALHIKL